ncbi:MAG: hypothetical protein NZZ41_07925 [Candidatus Dojkabacteria bacterium]|nr:hypothetical protein [Candidatus Dojkabacteria bacterium]
MYNTVPSVTFDEIIEDVKRVLALIGVYRFYEILAVDPDTTPEATMRIIIERANAEFSKYMPLVYVQKFYFNNERVVEFIDNFDLYLAGSLSSDNILLVPDAVVGLSNMPHFHAKYNVYKFSYQPPYLILNYPLSGLIYIKTLCKYRINFDANTPSNNAIYFMHKQTPVYDVFLKQVVYNTALHIVMLKKNYSITELPIEVFNGLEEYMSELKSELETLYNESYRNYLIMY